jgi:hypothetical protein
LTSPYRTTKSAFLRELETLDIKFSSKECALLARAAHDIERLSPILAQRERDRLLKMPPATKEIQ